MNAPEQSDADNAEGDEVGGDEVGGGSTTPSGNAFAFRRALDAQAVVDGLGNALIPSGPHDLTIPIERVRIPGDDAAETPLDRVATDAQATARNPRNRVPPWSPSVRWIGTKSETAATTVAPEPAHLAPGASPERSSNPARSGFLSASALKSHEGERFGRARLAIIASATLAAVAVTVIMLTSEDRWSNLLPLALPTEPVMSEAGAAPAASATGNKTSANPAAGASRSAKASPKHSTTASPHASASATKAAPGNTAASAASASAAPKGTLSTGPAASTAAAGPALVNAQAAMCLDTAGSSYSPGLAEQVASCSGSAFQTWTLTSAGQLTQDGGAYCLDDYRWEASPGSAVDLWPCNGGANQQWTIVSDGSIVGTYSSLCLSVSGSTADLEPCDGRTSEQWSWQ
jgi:hypothetical protein